MIDGQRFSIRTSLTASEDDFVIKVLDRVELSACGGAIQGCDSGASTTLSRSIHCRFQMKSTLTIWPHYSFLLRDLYCHLNLLVHSKGKQLWISLTKVSWSAAELNPAYFLVFFRDVSSLSFSASSLNRCCSRFSAAVIRGMISSKGLSMTRIVLILGGLQIIKHLKLKLPWFTY